VTITGLATNTTYTITLNALVAGNTVQSASTTITTASPAVPYTTFTTITQQTNYTPVAISMPTFTVPDGGLGGIISVAVNVAQTKMLISLTTTGTPQSSGYYSTYSGSSWSTPTLVPNSIQSVIDGNRGNICTLSPDGTKGLLWGNGGFVSVDWSGSTPVGTAINSSIYFSRGSLSISTDGTFVVATLNSTAIYYTVWQSGTSRFSNPQRIGTLVAPHVSGAISQDKSVIMFHNGDMEYEYITVTWVGSNPTFSSTTTFNYINTTTSTGAWHIAFAGGNSTTPSTYLLTFKDSMTLFVYKWNNTTKALTYQYRGNTGSTPGVSSAFTGITGANGNIIYLPTAYDLTSKALTISTITLPVS
jgi:hypothetical protein